MLGKVDKYARIVHQHQANRASIFIHRKGKLYDRQKKGTDRTYFCDDDMGFRFRRERHIFGVFFPIPNIDHAFFVGIHTDGGNFFRPAEACDQKDLSQRHRPWNNPLIGFLV